MKTCIQFATIILLVSVLFTTCKQPEPDPMAPTISGLSPRVLIPGGPLSLTGTNFSNLTSVDFLTETGGIMAKVYVQSFLPIGELPISAGFITIKVPMGVAVSSYIRINNEYGNGKPHSLDRMTGSEPLNLGSVAISVPSITTGSISDGCVPKSFFYCIPLPDGSSLPGGANGNPDRYDTKKLPKNSRLVMGFKVSPNDYVLKGLYKFDAKTGRRIYPPESGVTGDYCQKENYYGIESRGSIDYHVFRGLFNDANGGVPSDDPWVILKLERNSLTNKYTGSAIIEISTYEGKTTYVGSMLKKGNAQDTLINGDIYAYSVKTGKEIRLCSQTGFSGVVDKQGNIVNCPACK